MVAVNYTREINVKSNTSGTITITSSNTNKVIVTVPEDGSTHVDPNTYFEFQLKGVAAQSNPVPITISFVPDGNAVYGPSTITYYALAYRWSYLDRISGLSCHHSPECTKWPCTKCSAHCAGRAVYWYGWNYCGSGTPHDSYDTSGDGALVYCYCLRES